MVIHDLKVRMNWNKAGAGWAGLAYTHIIGHSAVLGAVLGAYYTERGGLAKKMAAHLLVCVG